MLLSLIVVMLLLLSVFHFVYEFLVAPTLLQSASFELFKLRDEIRRRKIRGEDRFAEETYFFLEDSLNSAIDNLQCFTLSFFLESRKKLRTSENLRHQLEEMGRLLEEDPQAQAAYESLLRTTLKAFAINSGGWLPYLLPIVVLAWIFNQTSKVSNRFIALLNQVFLSEGHLHKDLNGEFSPAASFFPNPYCFRRKYAPAGL
ncbi:MAG: hypothetical protein D6765_16675 [Bacteroidetes bacterium]|nr:MAG: hypothetical protein D6765_16675 [Bacteroidota bacterium]